MDDNIHDIANFDQVGPCRNRCHVEYAPGSARTYTQTEVEQCLQTCTWVAVLTLSPRFLDLIIICFTAGSTLLVLAPLTACLCPLLAPFFFRLWCWCDRRECIHDTLADST